MAFRADTCAVEVYPVVRGRVRKPGGDGSPSIGTPPTSSPPTSPAPPT